MRVTPKHQKGTSPTDGNFVEALSRSQIFRDYARAFTSGTDLPLSLHLPELRKVVGYVRKQQNPFCTLVGKSMPGCAACLAAQQKLEGKAGLRSETLKCFAGLCETSVPIHVGEKLIAFLQTGQVLQHSPSRIKFNRIAKTLLKWGAQVDLKKLDEAYFNTRVISQRKYEALIQLLIIFAGHLAASANQIILQSGKDESIAISQARTYVDAHLEEEFSICEVARFVNMSAHYFGEKFREATGVHFSEYVARTRIEKARHFLLDPQLRIGEIAFQVGFHSLSQFNRSFKSVTDLSPSEYRRKMAPVLQG